MRLGKVGSFAGATVLALLWSFTVTNAAEVGVCAIVDKPASFNPETMP
jgi:hypothetical protein